MKNIGTVQDLDGKGWNIEMHLPKCECDECFGACTDGTCKECFICEVIADNDKFWQANKADILGD